MALNQELNPFRSLLKTPFEKRLLSASLNNLEDSNNALRVNNFAFSLRALIEIYLKRVCPEGDVKSCVWYLPPTKKDKENGAKDVNLRQKIKFSIQGGFSDCYIEQNHAGLNIESNIKDLRRIYQKLSSYTHITESTFQTEQIYQENAIHEIINHVNSFAKSHTALRRSLRKSLRRKSLKDEFFDVFINDHIDDLAVVAAVPEYANIVKRTILYIDDKYIYVEVKGLLECEHRMGKKEDYFEFPASYPFTAILSIDVKDLNNISINPSSFNVNLEKWYH